jgi:hypothetical protein
LKSNEGRVQERNQEKRSPRGRKFIVIIITVEACAVLLSIHIQNERSTTTTTEEEEVEEQQKNNIIMDVEHQREREEK